MSILDDMKKWRDAREVSNASRDGFVRLNERQQEVFATQADRLDKFESTAGITINSMARLRVYVKLLDIHLGPFIGKAKSRARTAYLTGTRNWHQQYIIDVADVEIKLVGRSVFITIKPADSFYFEFASTGKPVVTETVVQDGIPFGSYKGCMVGVNVRLDNGVLKTKPTILKQKRSVNFDELSLVHRQAQVQLINEPVVYPFTEYKFGRTRAKQTLFESFAPGHAWSGILRRDTEYPLTTFQVSTAGGPAVTHFIRDVYIDAPYEDGEKSNPIRLAYLTGSGSDWPRASGKLRVVDKEFGEREFGVYVTHYNEFIIFPTAAIQPLNVVDPYLQNVPEVYVQRKSPDFPAWAYKSTQKGKDYWAITPDVGKWSVDQPEIDWKFAPDGTKAAAIVFEREEMAFDSTYWATNANPDGAQEFTQTDFDTIVRDWCGVEQNYVMSFSSQTYAPTRYFVSPAVFEVDIKIELTGPDLNQYVAQLTTTAVRRLSTAQNDAKQNRWAMAVGYVWHDIPKRTNTDVSVKAGTLVALDLDYYVKPVGTRAADTERLTLLTVRDVKQDIDVFSCVGSPVIAVDLTTLSMVLRLDSYSTETKYGDGGASPLPFVVHHFGAMIVHSGVVKEVLLPDTIPDAEKLKLAGYAQLNGKQYLATLGAGWEYVAPTTPREGYDGDLATLRDEWAKDKHFWYLDWFAFLDPDWDFYGTAYPSQGYVKYKTGSFGGLPESGETFLNKLGGDWQHLMFCTSPRWGWHQYHSLTAKYLYINIFDTFFTHPNGTYAFFSDAYIYDRNGIPAWATTQLGPGQTGPIPGAGDDWQIDTLALYDATKVEHVIFDRVHFEIRAKDQPARGKNTSFMELYNRAVQLGKEAKTLPEEENLNEFVKSDLQATFQKDTADDTSAEYLQLNLKVTYKGREGWTKEAAFLEYYGSASPRFPPFAGTCGNFNNLTLYGYFRETQENAGGPISVLGGSSIELNTVYWPYRFANPLLVMEK